MADRRPARFRLPLRRAHLERELDEELRVHIDMRVEALRARGLDPRRRDRRPGAAGGAHGPGPGAPGRVGAGAARRPATAAGGPVPGGAGVIPGATRPAGAAYPRGITLS
jgi:hypothetical protein